MTVEVVDLVSEFRYAEVRHEQPLIDLGTPQSATALVGGWSWNETDPAGSTFVWAVGPRSEVGVFLAWARDLEVRMRCRAFRYPGAPPQVLRLFWDDTEIASLELDRGFGEQQFTVPAERATPGNHRLGLVPAYFGRPEVTGDPGPAPRHPRKLSFACDWIAPGDGSIAGEARGEGETLWIPEAGEVTFFLEPESELDLRWESIAPRGVDGLDVVWEVEGASPVTAVIAQDSDPVLRLPLPPVSERGSVATAHERMESLRPARLTLRAAGGVAVFGEGEAGVVLRRPRLTGNGRARLLPDRALEVSPADEPGVAATSAERDERDPESILLWIVDTLRVDRLGFHGHERPVSPNFDALAERSTVFERAVAQSSWTRPTVATLLTGVGPERHGIRELNHGLDASFATLPERLRELGYATAGFSANANVTGDTGFEQGFDRFEYDAVDVDTLARWALDWLDQVAAETPDKPFFLMVLSVEPHASFDPAEPFRERFAADVQDRGLGTVEHMRALSNRRIPSTPEVVDQLFLLYDAEIAWNDHVFGEFRRELDSRGRNPSIVVVSDHGEAFEERGVFGHAWDLHREVLDIPFLIHLSGQGEGRRVSVPVQQADLLPTLIEIAGGEAGPGIDGDSLLPLLDAGSAATAGGFEGLSDRLLLSTMDTFRRPAASLVRGRYKLIELRRPGHAPSRQLFDRTADPEELHDLAAERPLLAGVMARHLREQLDLAAGSAVDAVDVELDEDTRRRLQALGYIE
ncbi:MAG: sulfatase [Acidobacteriota bacterium]|nr:sulfatase [Acidobacteriota bacterium]MDE3264545.1 sulfatase [Acidobacteriota bacterium]